MPLSGLELSVAGWLLAIGCGALLGADSSSWPQAMVSRPVVAGFLGGALLGDAAAGFLVGAVLELLVLRHPPFGAARYPDMGPAGLVAGGAYASAGGEGFYPFLASLLAGWALGWVGARSVARLRRWNGRLVGAPAVNAASPARFQRRHRLAIRLDFARGGLLTAAFLVPAAFLARLAVGIGPGTHGSPLAVAAVALGLGVAGGAGARSLGGRRRGWALIAVGTIVGLAVLG
ncbi:MAG: PTS sugar transporter subunit IIC [Gemmatimonadota bacterium]